MIIGRKLKLDTNECHPPKVSPVVRHAETFFICIFDQKWGITNDAFLKNVARIL